jgi:hypothetical protein
VSDRRRYTVRKQSSGYSFSETWYAYDLIKQGRVTVNAHSVRESAQADADRLEILGMVADHDRDPRPFDVRLAEAAQRFAAGETARTPFTPPTTTDSLSEVSAP